MNISLTTADIAALSPLLTLLFGSLIILLMETFWSKSSAKLFATLASLTFVCAGYFALSHFASGSPLLAPWLKFDAFALFFTLFFLSVGFFTVLLSISFFKSFRHSSGEYYFLLISAVFGLILIGSAADFLTLFIGLETLSIALYILCGYVKKWKIAEEAATKYFLLGSLGAALLLYGIALLYGAMGTTSFEALLPTYQQDSSSLFLVGITLMTIGLAFKAAIVPFHVWAPDVYDGASTPITAFMAVATKAGAFAALARIFIVSLPFFDIRFNEAVSILAILTLIYANFVAIKQKQLRRFFAYSGISHAGFMLIAIVVGSQASLHALSFYLVIYAFATLGAFAALMFLDSNSDGVLIKDLNGLIYRSPWLCIALSLCLLTLAGIPPTAGFFAKFYLFKLAFEAKYFVLLAVSLATTILSAFYYMRIVSYMFSSQEQSQAKISSIRSLTFAAGLAFAAIVTFSIFPEPLMNLLASISATPAV